VPARQREWHLDNNIFTLVLCKNCQANNVKWSVNNKRYSTYCSGKCAQSNPAVKLKRQQTCVEKFGAASNLSTTENKAKQKATCIARYGTDNFAKTTEFVTKSKQTFLNNYGVDNPMHDPAIKQRNVDTHMARYDRKRASQLHLSNDVIDLKNNEALMREWFYDLKMPVTAIAEVLNVNHSQLCVHFRDNLGIDISRHGVSYPEQQLFQFVQSLCPDAISSDRLLLKPKELDIVVPSKRIAIEFHGLAWHCEIRGKKSQKYHLEKLEKCNDAGYHLIQVLSNEWNKQQELVKSRIATKLGHGKKIFGRNCTVQQITSQQADEFLKQTHIQGSCVSAVAFGLFNDDKLVAVMTFGKPRFNKQFEWELLRLSTALNTSVVGGASKLFKAFVKSYNPLSVISYCDRRWNNGNVYDRLGFVHSRTSGPNYWYVSNSRHLHNRMQFQKHKLSKKLATFDPELTEWENMQVNGYDRFWDCGNSVWEWHRP